MATTPELDLAKMRVQLAKLDQHMASGILTIEGGDGIGRATYRSYAEMRAARSDLVGRINALAATIAAAPIRRTRQVVVTSRSGW
ncbi:phage head-tail joining protein [Methylobacterium goesingense]|uniref:Phage tail protein n=1 Tax=Methylobacterium goesingense TaxID=243690 RepID=A0ABV2L412_9HYPH|nr:hypothetical protein [Methylobacterium goesingense]GJD73358.1 hypothetical protein CFIICLFH_1585 [Methylobacterium goesingense]